MGTLVLLDLMGGVALLLWGLHMVHSGILRAFGPDLRRLLSHALGNRFAAFAAGLGLTALLQSSTATALMTASFTTEGMVALIPALAIMLGANVGTTLIVQLLSFNIAAAAPVLFVIGLVAFRSGGRSRLKDIGRVGIGLGLMLLALHILLDTLAPAEQAPVVRTLLGAITGDPILCVVIAAALTWAAHSSVATVLLFMSLAYSNFITPAAALALVLGANLGSAINPLFEGARRDDPKSYRLPVGNLINRIVGVALVLPFLHPLAERLIALEPDVSKMTAGFHVAFNVALAVLFIGLLGPLARLLETVFPGAGGGGRPEHAAASRSVRARHAVAGAGRRGARDAAHGRPGRGDAAAGDDGADDQRPRAGRRSFQDGQRGRPPRRGDQALCRQAHRQQPRRARGPARHGDRSFSINLEHIGDIIDKNLSELADKKAKRKLQFSAEGAAELQAFHGRILEISGAPSACSCPAMSRTRAG